LHSGIDRLLREDVVEKRDLAKEHPELYSPSKDRFVFVDVPELCFLMVDGTGSPEASSAFQEAIGALYSVAYTLRFALKRERELDWKVMPLEGLFWTNNNGHLVLDGKADWNWTLLLLQPDFVTHEEVARAAEAAGKKKPLPGLRGLRFEALREGPCVQTLYLGAYADEKPTIDRMHAFIAEQGYTLRGKHHEIYLGDPRRTKPERLRTVIRQPVGKA
jgi:hypothetical protein